MPTPPRRWSPRLEEFRAGADTAAQHADAHLDATSALLTEALRHLRDPELVARLIADALAEISQARTEQARIQRLMLEARIGRE